MKKANQNRFFMAHNHHGVDLIYSNGGRAEQSRKVFGIEFLDAQVQQDRFESFLVDVPRFELGASTMPR